ncbi:GH92 family glycosyl hydrolase [Persicobacter psychrovividus]|uniref:Alpha-1 2-mannosidase n=1 Tax=Persicobacter psychrovividus TaxID=387638 RepID=A0ABN6LG55_9BACT|nr:alpha-1 2-mannosidase [Persicobacter psychrovividus]
MLKHLFFSVAVLLAWSSSLMAQSYADYVNPFIGTSNYGATYPGAIAPRPMATVSPFNAAGKQNKFDKDSQWNSMAYWHENTFLTGFSHVNLSGVGCPDLGVILTMPTTGKPSPDWKSYGSTYSQEQASAGYYAVHLDKYNVEVEATASRRVGISKYHFPAGESNVLLNLGLGLTNEQGAMLKVVSDHEIEGMVTVGSFCYNNPKAVYPVYFVMELSKPADDFGIWKEARPNEGVEAQWMKGYNGQLRMIDNYRNHVVGDSIGAYMHYSNAHPMTVEVKVAVSYVSIANARENLRAETAGKDFDQVLAATKQDWNDALGVVEVKGGSEDDKTMFYTALYHTLIHPNIQSDVNGDYNLAGHQGFGNSQEHERYSVFSLWDTYRSLHPLMSLLYPHQQSQMVKTMLDIYDESGWLPKWELNSTETYTMVGDPAMAVIGDTYLRGIHDFDTKKAMEAMKKHFSTIEDNPVRPGNKAYQQLGYIPVESEKSDLFDGGDEQEARVWGSVSTSLEYNIADYAFGQFAKAIGEEEWSKKALAYTASFKDFYDPSTKVLRPKMANGEFMSPFNPKDGENFTHAIGYVEGSAYHYAFMVPHAIPELIATMGGEKQYLQALDQLFAEGHYEPDNEPDMAYPFLYNYVKGQEWKTQRQVRKMINESFSNTPAGLPGNDDTGTMSSLLAFSMMGIYPESAGSTKYLITTPRFEEVVIHLDKDYYHGDKIVIKAPKATDRPYIKSLTVNGKKQSSLFIDHQTLTEGAEINFKLSKTPQPAL